MHVALVTRRAREWRNQIDKGDKKMLKRMIGAIAMVLSLNATVATAAYQNWPWTTAGSTGTVDEQSVGVVRLSSGNAYLDPTAVVGASGTIRYDVIGTEGLTSNSGIAMAVRYKDGGLSEQVRASLKRYNMFTGATTTLLTFDSDTWMQSSSSQRREVYAYGICPSPGPGFDFNDSIYYVEVTLTRTSTAPSSAMLFGISIATFKPSC
jgi:hypothetical protein